jgi:hypothetical protein
MKKIIDGLLYDTETALEVASDEFWDGNNFDRNGRSNVLYKTVKGRFFMHHKTRWQGECNSIVALSKDEAMDSYEELSESTMEYKDAFGIEPEQA